MRDMTKGRGVRVDVALEGLRGSWRCPGGRQGRETRGAWQGGEDVTIFASISQ